MSKRVVDQGAGEQVPTAWLVGLWNLFYGFNGASSVFIVKKDGVQRELRWDFVWYVMEERKPTEDEKVLGVTGKVREEIWSGNDLGEGLVLMGVGVSDARCQVSSETRPAECKELSVGEIAEGLEGIAPGAIGAWALGRLMGKDFISEDDAREMYGKVDGDE